MTIIAHEGLPGSGKSLAAVKDWIVPQLKAGRVVCAYVEGLNHKRIAELAGITEDDCKARLIPLTREQVPDVWKEGVIPDGCFLVLDEVQNFWPKQRKPLDEPMIQFITEHRHRGLDILIMGQEVADAHTTWFNRIDTKYVFLKMDGVGKPDHFYLSVQKRNTKKKFVETSSVKSEYDKAYFDTYKSHVDGASSAVLGDQRANVWNHPVIRHIKKFGVVVVIAVGVLIWLFSGGLAGSVKDQPKPQQKDTPVSAQPQPVQVQPVHQPVQVQPVSHPSAPPPVQSQGGFLSGVLDRDRDQFASIDMLRHDPVADLFRAGRARLSSVMVSGRHVRGNVQFWTDQGRLIDSLSFDQLKELGWFVFLSDDRSMAILRRAGAQFLATGWQSFDVPGRSPTALQDQIRDQGKAGDSRPGAGGGGSDSGHSGARGATAFPPDFKDPAQQWPAFRDLKTGPTRSSEG